MINFISARPSKNWEGYAELGYSSYNDVYAEAAVGGPLSDRVRFRVSGRAEKADGYWKNYAPGGKDYIETKFFGIRGQLEVDVSDTLTALVSVSFDKNPKHVEGVYKAENFYIKDGQPTVLPANVDAYGTGPGNDISGYRDEISRAQGGLLNNQGFFKNERFSPTLTLTQTIGDMTITSLTNYTKFSFGFNEDCDGGPVDYCQFPFSENMKQYSEELRVNGTTGNLTYTAGIYYLNVDIYNPTGFFFPSLSGTSYAFYDNNIIRQKNESIAAFGQLEYQVTDKLKLTIGGRYTHDRLKIDSKLYFHELGNGYSGGTGTTVFDPPLLTYDFSEATVGDLATHSVDLFSGKIGLDYKPNKDVLLYASVSRGVKGPGFNTNISGNLTTAETPFKSEYLYAYEIGAKLQLLDKMLRMDIGAYNYDYHRFQGYAFTGLQGVVGNYDGYFRGGELALTATPFYGFSASLGAAYLQTKLKDVPTKYNGVIDQEGVLAPKWTLNGQISQRFDIGQGHLDVKWSGNYIGSRYSSIDNNAATFIRPSFVHNIRAAYTLPDSGVEFAVFMNNISNKDRETYSFDFVATTGSVVRSYDKPRWIGGSIRKTF